MCAEPLLYGVIGMTFLVLGLVSIWAVLSHKKKKNKAVPPNEGTDKKPDNP